MRWLILSLFVLVADQLTKFWIKTNIALHEQLSVFPGFNLILACNKGAAFSFLSQESGWQRWFFAVVAGIVSIVILVWLIKLPTKKYWLACSLALILGGAIGNLWDRVLIGCVVDFIQVYLSFLPWELFNPWPSFNIADSAIFIGAVMLIIDSFRNGDDELQSSN